MCQPQPTLPDVPELGLRQSGRHPESLWSLVYSFQETPFSATVVLRKKYIKKFSPQLNNNFMNIEEIFIPAPVTPKKESDAERDLQMEQPCSIASLGFCPHQAEDWVRVRDSELKPNMKYFCNFVWCTKCRKYYGRNGRF